MRGNLRFMVRAALCGLLICASVGAQGESYTLKYDRFKDKTTVSSKLMILSGSYQDGVGLKLTGEYEGKAPRKPDTVILAIISAAPEKQLAGDKELILLLDGERLKLGAMQNGGAQFSSGVIIEPVVMVIPFDTVARIAKAKTVEGKIGPREFAVSEANLSIIRAFLSHFGAQG